MTTETIHETVREHYAGAAIQVLEGASGAAATAAVASMRDAGSALYSALERDELPEAAVLASLGCGNPIAVADLHPGERVLDLGSGGGIDVLLSARRVGPTGRAFGLDMTDEMLALAARNAAEAGLPNVEFLKGTIEAIPLPAASIDVVISNCVVNLAADKPAVFREIARVLRPGGRIGITDIVADDEPDAGRTRRARLICRLHRRRPVVRRVPGRPACRRAGRGLHHADARRGPGDVQRDRQGHEAGRRWRGGGGDGGRRRGRDERPNGGPARRRHVGLLLMATGPMSTATIERATAGDLPAVEALLGSAGLPLDGVVAAFGSGVVARDGGRVVGCAAVELYGDAALVRSVAVHPRDAGAASVRRSWPRSRVGARRRRPRGVPPDRDRRGLVPALRVRADRRAEASPAIGASVEFTSACTATCAPSAARLGADVGPRRHRRPNGRRPCSGARPGRPRVWEAIGAASGSRARRDPSRHRSEVRRRDAVVRGSMLRSMGRLDRPNRCATAWSDRRSLTLRHVCGHAGGGQPRVRPG